MLAGGTLVCTGAGCTASFTKMTFHSSTLLVLNGAQVTLQAPSFTNMATAVAGLSIFAHGEGTRVLIQGGSVVIRGTAQTEDGVTHTYSSVQCWGH